MEFAAFKDRVRGSFERGNLFQQGGAGKVVHEFLQGLKPGRYAFHWHK